ncbi:hypothetical protein SAMN05519104_6018 [Rhizobiales bacterium GAS188]|nr:hypothetical protein SAMN05519104_6018 [Rhizobiales bacterium GAS188]
MASPGLHYLKLCSSVEGLFSASLEDLSQLGQGTCRRFLTSTACAAETADRAVRVDLELTAIRVNLE